MSNNIYDILKKMQNLEASKQSLTESKKAKPDFADLDKDGDKTEPMKKAAKEKSKGAIAEAVARVESQLNEKYMGFKKTVAAIKKGESAENPEAVAASIGRKKYGKEKFQKAAAAGKKLGEDNQSDMKAKDKASRDAEFKADMEFVKSGGGHVDTSGTAYDRHGNPAFNVKARSKLEKDRDYPLYRQPGVGDGMPDRPVKEDNVEESGLQAYLGKKKYGETGMKALQKAGREGASKEKMAMIRARHDKMDEGEADQYEQDPYGQYRKKIKPGNTIGSKIAAGAKNIKRKAEKFVANTMGHNLERGPLGEHNYTEDMLSPAQKKFAALADPKDKITYADKIAGAKKGKKTEGNKFSGNLMKARAAGLKQADLDGDGKMEPVHEETGEERDAAARRENERYDSARNYQGRNARGDVIRSGGEVVRGNPTPPSLMQKVAGKLGLPNTAKDALGDPLYKSSKPTGGSSGGGGGRAGGMGGHITDPGAVKSLIPNFESKKSMREGWDEMQKYLEKKRGPESKGGTGKKAGTRYGGSAQTDEPDTDNETGQVAKKGRGRPKKDKFAE